MDRKEVARVGKLGEVTSPSKGFVSSVARTALWTAAFLVVAYLSCFAPTGADRSYRAVELGMGAEEFGRAFPRLVRTVPRFQDLEPARELAKHAGRSRSFQGYLVFEGLNNKFGTNLKLPFANGKLTIEPSSQGPAVERAMPSVHKGQELPEVLRRIPRAHEPRILPAREILGIALAMPEDAGRLRGFSGKATHQERLPDTQARFYTFSFVRGRVTGKSRAAHSY